MFKKFYISQAELSQVKHAAPSISRDCNLQKDFLHTNKNIATAEGFLVKFMDCL